MIIYENLKRATELANASGATIVAASKLQSKETIDELMSLSPSLELGENRAQEFTEKYDERYVWHFIGRLQRNKAKYVVGKVKLIHSLDSVELASEIDRLASKRALVQHCLIEINMGEEQKGGIKREELGKFVEELKRFDNIFVDGLMAVMPKECDLEAEYASLKRTFDDAAKFNGKNMDMRYLSAGMSGDFEIALRHGANIIRLGQFLFGKREYAEKQIADAK